MRSPHSVSRLVCVLALAGCGRLGFDSNQVDVGPLDGPVDGFIDGSVEPRGHDEDGDGVPDTMDSCPHLPGATTDRDGDGVGDLCDPNPDAPGDAIALFATMEPGNQPFVVGGGDPSAVFTQLPDALRFDGEFGDDVGLFGNLQFPIELGNVRLALGIDLIATLPGSGSGQHQIALSAWDTVPHYFIEVNQVRDLLDRASIVLFDGSLYSDADSDDLANGVHPGDLFMQTTQRVGVGVQSEIGWPGEMYEAEVTDTLYQGASRIEMNFNNVHFEIRWLVVITF